MKKAWYPLDDSGGHEGPLLQKFPHPDPLPEGEGIWGVICPYGPIEMRTGMLEKKYALIG